MSDLVQDSRRGCLRMLSIQAIAIGIVLPLGFLFICMPLFLVMNLEWDIWWLIIPASLFLLIPLVGGVGGLFYVVFKRKQGLDAATAPFGLQGNIYHLFFRQYHGRVGGREVGIYFYRGPTMEIHIPTPLQTRLGIAKRRTDTAIAAGWMKRDPLVLEDPALDDLLVYALDEDWSTDLLTQPQVAEHLQRLTQFEGPFTRRQLIFRPGWVMLQLMGSTNILDFTFDIRAEQMRSWLNGLFSILEIAERLPSPQVTDQESGAESFARSMRQGNPYRLVIITLVLIGSIIACSLVVGVLATLFAFYYG